VKRRGMERGKEGEWSVFFTYLFEKRTLKSVEMILSRGEGDEAE
jgi:hypothetical protein